MTEKELTNKLAKLGYTNLWLNYGILTIQQLISQEQEFDNSEDKNTEHYRCGAFVDFLQNRIKLSDTDFDNLIVLILQDEDESMANAITVTIFETIELTDSQFEKLCATIMHFGDRSEKIMRYRLLRKLKHSALTDEFLKECIENGDRVVHEHILEIANIIQLQELTIKGRNKRIRNVATEKLKKLTRQINSTK